MLSILLVPFAWLFGLIVGLRNMFYDLGWKRSYSFDQAVIVVGNLSVGGTGKTPMIEYLVDFLQEKYSVAILSRGYGRNTRGFRLAENHDNARTLGDEPFQFYRKFGKQLPIVVCESRVEGISKLLKEKPNVQVILLDDAFQHRAVKPLLSILLTDFSNPFFEDYLLPRGRLRENRKGSKRADLVIVTKCKSIGPDVESGFSRALQFYTNKPIFFSGVQYGAIVPWEEEATIRKEIVLVTGIANSKPIMDYAQSKFDVIYHFRFNDHHNYSIEDIAMIQKKCSSPEISILTTEKDMVKLILPEVASVLDKKIWFYLPIQTYFLNSGAEFDELVMQKIKTHLHLPLSKIIK